ncbi:hypothetical protein [Microcoleus sp. bin38.metabat.b11b12b14.051]|nr:hypothetical protein [Microcoleus sp. bin38.metabat.b11b12b14.051]
MVRLGNSEGRRKMEEGRRKREEGKEGSECDRQNRLMTNTSGS